MAINGNVNLSMLLASLKLYFHNPIMTSFLLFCCARRILIFPKGNNVDYLSMYLDVADSANLPYGWSRYAQFNLSIVNQIHNKYSIRKGTSVRIQNSDDLADNRKPVSVVYNMVCLCQCSCILYYDLGCWLPCIP